MIDPRTAGRPAVRKLPNLSRRGLLAGAAAFAVSTPGGLRAAAPSRLAAIDWAMLETALAIGAPLVAATELTLFAKAALEPSVPPEVADLGLRGSINYERLLSARPDLILISPWYENRAPMLSRIAPVASFTVYEAGRGPYGLAVEATRRLGALVGRMAEAERAIADADAELASARAALGRLQGRRVLIINLADARHFRVFGADSMFGDVAARLGLALAWAAPTRFGAYPTVGVEALGRMGDAIVVNVGPTPPVALAEATESPLWRAMPPIAASGLLSLDPVNPYGALPAARRFARLLTAALAGTAHE